jgi:HemY protein
MRTLLWFLILAGLAVGLSLAARYNDGYALLVMPPWRIELSLNLLGALLIGSFILGYLILRFVATVVRLPRAVRAFRLRQVQAKADGALRDAMRLLQEGRFSQAIKSAEYSFNANHAPGLAALVALRAAHALHDSDREDLWLSRAAEHDNETRAARLMTEAELAVEGRRYMDAREALNRLAREGGRHIAALRLALRTEQGQGNWDEVLKLTRQLEKHKALTAEQAAPLRMRAHRENLAGLSGDAEQLVRYWRKMPEQDRREVRLALTAARALAAADDCGEAAQLVEDFLDEQWDSSLVEAYGECEGGDVLARIAHAEKWLATHPRDAKLLLTLGRLCRRKQLWGKAQSYLEASLAVEASRIAHLELGGLLDSLDKPAAADRHYRVAALL